LWYPRGVPPAVDRLLERYGADRVTSVLRSFLTDKRAERIEQVLDARLVSVAAVVENLHDPHNGAAAIRSLEGLGLAQLHVVETLEQFDFSDAVTIGAEKWISVQRHRSFDACAGALREQGLRLFAMVPRRGHERAVSIDDADVSQPFACVFGNERDGLAAESVAACDLEVTLPMYGFTQSFNLSVSVALVVQKLAQRRRDAIGAPGDLSDRERALLRARWYALSVRHAEEILTQRVSESTRDDVAGLPQADENG